MRHGQKQIAISLLLGLLVTEPSALVLGQSPETGPQRAVLFGKALDDALNTPIEGVTIEVVGSSARVVTDARGDFIVSLSRGQQVTLTLTRIGYRQLTQLVDIPAGDTSRVNFFLSPAATTLDTVNVNATAVSRSPRLAGYEYRRQQHIGGVFITRAQIERRNPIATSQLFFNLLGARVIDSAGVKLIASTRGYKPIVGSALGPKLDIAPCVMAIGVDGQLKEWGFSVDEIPPNEIHGIEVYSGPATMPREFTTLRPDGYCGLVMIWTRADR